MPIKIAINGLGRIGRLTLRKLLKDHKNLEVVALNDFADSKTISHLLKYDSLYGVFEKGIGANDKNILVDKKEIKVFKEKEPKNLPWKDLKIDVVLECTGEFTDLKGAGQHLEAGAKKVIISAPAKSEEIPTYLLGVNEKNYNPEKDNIISMGSCTINCLAPIAKVLDENFKIVSGFMSTIHSYTNDQKILDQNHKDLRRARAAALNIIPTTTGVAKTIEKCLPALKGKLDGIALRVPTPTVSLVDFICQVKKETSAQEVNYALREASKREDLKGILGVEDAPLVSSDFKGSGYSAIVDSLLTMANINLVKVVAWYDNEWGYACRLAEMAEFIGKRF